ncbi:hypothetical protein HY493_04705 [Candidatus Woesearchaeota archaeon]|nr:hypothetical protein [Candidatus Woesearchaeota archaeon]
MDLIARLTEWEAGLVGVKSFNPVSAFNAARTLVPSSQPSELEALMRGIAERFPRNPFYKKYGLFVSAAVDTMLRTAETIVVPLRIIDQTLQAKETLKLRDIYGGLTTLDYLGFRNRRERIVYDGDAGDRFCFEAGNGSTADSPSTVALTGDAGAAAGAHQRANSTIIILGNAGNRLNEHQLDGVTYVGGDAGIRVNHLKVGGFTYVNGSVKRLAAKDMSGGGLVVSGSVGPNWASGLKGIAEVCICGKAAQYEADRPGGTIHVGTQMPPWAHDLSQKYMDEVTHLDLQGFTRYVA